MNNTCIITYVVTSNIHIPIHPEGMASSKKMIITKNANAMERVDQICFRDILIFYRHAYMPLCVLQTYLSRIDIAFNNQIPK